VAGDAWRKLGKREMAVKEWSLYLSLMPDAPDRKVIEQSIAATRRDIEMTPPRPNVD
jgi:cytochrome c-type biogenesis protein CcmH/NrfG